MTPEHKDPILEEIRQIREEILKEANYDITAICQRHQEEWGVAEDPPTKLAQQDAGKASP